MKKIVSLILIVFMLFSVLTFPATAETNDLLINGNFETGDSEGWAMSGPNSNLEVSEEAAHKGSYGMSVSNRTGRYSTVAQNLADIYYNNGPGTYKASMWIKLAEPVEDRVKCQLVISYAAGGTGTKWITSRILTLTEEWQEFTIEQNFSMDIYSIESMLIYPQVESSSGETNVDFYFDDASFVKTTPVIAPDPNYVDIDVVPDAKTENLIPNGNFETADQEEAVAEGRIDFEFEKEYAHTGEYGLLVSNRGHKYSTVRWDLEDIFWENGPGKYRGCIYIRLAEEPDEDEEIFCEFVTRYSLKGKGQQYIVGGRKKLTTKWQKIIFDKELNFDPNEVRELCIYPQVVSSDANSFAEFYIDDVTLYKTTDVVTSTGEREEIKDIEVNLKEITAIDVKKVERNPEPTTVGAIRWDAWYGHDGVERSVISEVEKTLSPKEFHFRAPFFAEVTEEGGIIIPEYTQEIFDEEMEYAIEAGIDYFAFYWYEDAMQTARKLYQTSKYNDKVKMCIMFGGGNGSIEQHQEMAKLLKEDYYMTVLNGRPLMYYDCTYESAKNQIAYYRGLCEKLGIPEPYVVCLKANSGEINLPGVDAIGDYAISNQSLNMSFSELASNAKKKWMSYQRGTAQYVPLVTTGYNLLPRYKNQVYWMTVETDKVADCATAEEIGAHLTSALEYMQDVDVKEKTKINTVLMYAWNEHDEGGWICPTLKVDENGNQLYGENGEKLIDTSRIEAVKKAIADFKNGGNDEQIVPNDENVNSNNWIYYVIGGAVVVIGIIVTVVVIKKKKKAEEND